MTNSAEPGTYRKGSKVRHARTAAEAVAAVYDGFKLEGTEPAGFAAEGQPDNPAAPEVDNTESGTPAAPDRSAFVN